MNEFDPATNIDRTIDLFIDKACALPNNKGKFEPIGSSESRFGLASDIAHLPGYIIRVFRAKRVCGPCLVKAECLEFALQSPDNGRVYAQKSPFEIETIRKSRAEDVLAQAEPDVPNWIDQE